MEYLCIIDFVKLYDKKDVRMQKLILKVVDDDKNENFKQKHRLSTFEIICNTVHFLISCHFMNNRMQFTGPDHFSLLLNAWQ
jgi:hypothetical protein